MAGREAPARHLGGRDRTTQEKLCCAEFLFRMSLTEGFVFVRSFFPGEPAPTVYPRGPAAVQRRQRAVDVLLVR